MTSWKDALSFLDEANFMLLDIIQGMQAAMSWGNDFEMPDF